MGTLINRQSRKREKISVRLLKHRKLDTISYHSGKKQKIQAAQHLSAQNRVMQRKNNRIEAK